MLQDAGANFVLAFQALPLVLVIGALSSLLFYWMILPYVVHAFSFVLRKTMNIGGALGLGASTTIFLGMVEAPLVIKPYLKNMVASRVGSATVADMLLAKGANVNARAARGQTSLMWAVAQKHPEVVKILLAHHADVHARSDAWSDVMAVPPHGYLDYNRAIPHGNDTPLLFAARVGDLASAKLLVAAGADVNDKDAWGISATVLAAHSGFGDLVDFMLEKRADPNAAEAGFTALHECF